MIKRSMQDKVIMLASEFPAVAITGPRQSGKTTLAKMAFPNHPYVSLEGLDARNVAMTDPRGFLAQFPDGAILDEIQRAPDLLSYLQGIIDDGSANGAWILTGSQHYSLMAGVSQSLAGRVGIAHLLPLALEEIRRFGNRPMDLDETLFTGGYPRIHDQGVSVHKWLDDYISTYVERDVRQVLAVGDLLAFQRFLGMAAGRTAQVLNLSGLGADCGIVHTTAKSWLSVLETGYISFQLLPLHANLGKRLTKRRKLHFWDSGLACRLLGITEPGQLQNHPLRGAIFETWVVTEILKQIHNRTLTPRPHYYREHRGGEIDLILQAGLGLLAVEAKSGATVAVGMLKPLRDFTKAMASARPPAKVSSYLVYGGDQRQEREAGTVLPWSEIGTVDWGASNL
ncbi:ATP-binding protein [bacterium]|nr:ATP-binding protein [bacterium]